MHLLPKIGVELTLANIMIVKNESLITDLIGKMSIEQKVGQVIQGDLDFISPADVNKYYIGSVLNGGNTSPNGDKYSSVKDLEKPKQRIL